jgi:multidrug efflux pump subunit AcrA (membrane-fusion protein)
MAGLKRFVLPLLIILAGVFVMKFLTSMKAEVNRKSKPATVTPLITKVIHFESISPVIQGMGRVEGTQSIELISEVSGLMLSSSKGFREGTRFNQGQILVQIHNEQATYQFRSSISDLMSGLAGILPDLKRDFPESYSKWNTFFEKLSFETIPELPEVSDSREKLFLSRHRIFNLYFAMRNLETQLHKHTLKAPFKGSVAKTSINPGAMIRAGVTLATLVSTGDNEVRLPLNHEDAQWIRTGMPAEIQIDGIEQVITGKISRVAASMDADFQTISAYISLTPPKGAIVMEGMFAKVKVKGNQIEKAAVVPASAIQKGNQVYSISDGRLKMVPVRILRKDHMSAYISEGIHSGDTIIVRPVQDAIEGMGVKAVLENN